MAEIETTWFHHVPGSWTHHAKVFQCTPQEFYRAMTTESTVVAFMLSDCKVDAKQGGTFDLFDVEGYFVKLAPYTTIVQRWRLKTWQRAYFSKVMIYIQQKNDLTEVHVWQHGIPEGEGENTSEAWKRIYWENIGATFDYNARLMHLIKVVERQDKLSWL